MSPNPCAARRRPAWRSAGIAFVAALAVLSAIAAALGSLGAEVVPARTDAPHIGGVAAGSPLPSVGTVAFPPPDWRWLNTTGASPPATEGSLAFLRGSTSVVWVGGSVEGTVATWEFAGGNWTNLTGSVTGAPPPNPGGALAAAPFADEVAWVAPYAGSMSLGLWTFANGTWTNDSARTPAPPARVGGAWATDPANDTIVLFGGESNGIYRNDTWSLGSAGWTAIGSARAPSPRALAGLAAPATGAVLVLTGGIGYGGALNDTWTFNGAEWTQERSAGAPYGITEGPNALTPTPGGDVLAFGGFGCSATDGLCNDTFEYVAALGVWRNVSSQYPPSPRAGVQLTYDPAAGYDLAYGGASGVGAPTAQTWAIGGPLVTTLVVAPKVAQPPSNSHYLSHAGGGYGTYTYVYSGQNVDCISRNVSDYLCPLDDDDNANYTVTGQVTDQMGNVTRASDPFQVLPALLVEENLSASVVDAGQPVNFSMSVTTPSVPVEVHWLDLPPDCPFDNLTAFTCASSVPGFYGINCSVVDQYGTQDVSTSAQLEIHPDPSVLAWPSTISGTSPLTVEFRSSVSGGTAPYVYNWSFGDGSFGSGAAPSHTFAKNGTYVVNLTVTDAVGVNATIPDPISVNVAPGLTASIVASAASWAAPAHVTLDVVVAGGTPPYVYRWTLGNAGTGTLPNVTTTYGEAGSYTATVTVLDAHGLVATAETTLTVTAGNATTSVSAGTTTPAWELAAIGIGGAVAGVVVGVVIGRRRRRGTSEYS